MESGIVVSVIVLSYKRKHFLEDAIRSVNEGSEKPSEIILAKCFEDNLMDKKFEKMGVIVQTFSEKVRYGDMLNSAVERSSGNVIILLEDDDMFYPRKVELIRDAFQKSEDIVMVKDKRTVYRSDSGYSKFLSFLTRGDNDQDIEFTDYQVPLTSSFVLAELFDREIDHNPSTMSFRRDFLAQSKGFLSCKDPVDSLLGLSIAAFGQGRIRFIEIPLTAFRVHGSNDSKPNDFEQEEVDRFAMLQKKNLGGFYCARMKVNGSRIGYLYLDRCILDTQMAYFVLSDRGGKPILRKDLSNYFRSFRSVNDGKFISRFCNFFTLPHKMTFILFFILLFNRKMGRKFFLWNLSHSAKH